MNRVFAALVMACVACGDAEGSAPLGERALSVQRDAGFTPIEPGPMPTVDASAPPTPVRPPAASNRFASRVVSVSMGACGGFGSAGMPKVVLGPPEGGGALSGSLDVLSLGNGGSITLSFEDNPIVDGPGVDFLVFENAFFAGGVKDLPYVDLAQVSVSVDGLNWVRFPCEAKAYPYEHCAGWNPVYSASETPISATDPSVAGGDPFDLALLGLTEVKFVKIDDLSTPPAACGGGTSNGFDLDAVASVNAKMP